MTTSVFSGDRDIASFAFFGDDGLRYQVDFTYRADGEPCEVAIKSNDRTFASVTIENWSGYFAPSEPTARRLLARAIAGEFDPLKSEQEPTPMPTDKHSAFHTAKAAYRDAEEKSTALETQFNAARRELDEKRDTLRGTLWAISTEGRAFCTRPGAGAVVWSVWEDDSIHCEEYRGAVTEEPAQ